MAGSNADWLELGCQAPQVPQKWTVIYYCRSDVYFTQRMLYINLILVQFFQNFPYRRSPQLSLYRVQFQQYRGNQAFLELLSRFFCLHRAGSQTGSFLALNLRDCVCQFSWEISGCCLHFIAAATLTAHLYAYSTLPALSSVVSKLIPV